MQCCIGNCNSANSNTEALLSKVGHEVHETIALLTEEVFRRNFNIGKEQLCSVLSMHPQLVEVATTFKTLHAPLYKKQRNTTMAFFGVGATHHNDHIAVDAIGDKSFGAIHNECTTLFETRRANASDVTSRIGLGNS